jgi:hypothetical protein
LHLNSFSLKFFERSPTATPPFQSFARTPAAVRADHAAALAAQVPGAAVGAALNVVTHIPTTLSGNKENAAP